MVILFFSRLLHRGKLRAELATSSFDVSGERGSQPRAHIQASAWHGRQQGRVFLFHPAAVPQVVGTKAVSGPVPGRLLCPSASVMLSLCYLMSSTACTREAAWLPGSSPSLPGAPHPPPASPHLLLTILLAPHKPLLPSLFPLRLLKPHLDSRHPSCPLLNLRGCMSI